MKGKLGFNIVVPLPDPIPLMEYKKYKNLEDKRTNMTTVDAPVREPVPERAEMELVPIGIPVNDEKFFNDMGEDEAALIIYVFLKLHNFRIKVDVFSFFIKYWMPYEKKTEQGRALWQKRCN